MVLFSKFLIVWELGRRDSNPPNHITLYVDVPFTQMAPPEARVRGGVSHSPLEYTSPE